MAEIKWTNVNDAGANAAMGNYLDAQKQFQYQVANIGKGLVDFTNTMDQGQKESNRKLIEDNTQLAINEMLQINDNAGYDAYRKSGAGIAENVLARFNGMVDLGKFNQARNDLEKNVYSRAQSTDNLRDYNPEARQLFAEYNKALSTGNVPEMQRIQERANQLGVSIKSMNDMGTTTRDTFKDERSNTYKVVDIQNSMYKEVQDANNQVAKAREAVAKAEADYINNLGGDPTQVHTSIAVQEAKKVLQAAEMNRQSVEHRVNEGLQILGLGNVKSSPISSSNVSSSIIERANQIQPTTQAINVNTSSSNVSQTTSNNPEPVKNQAPNLSGSDWFEQTKNITPADNTVKQANRNQEKHIRNMVNVSDEHLNTLLNKAHTQGLSSLSEDERKALIYRTTMAYGGDAEKANKALHYIFSRQQTARDGNKGKITNQEQIDQENKAIVKAYEQSVLNEAFPDITYNSNGEETINPLHIAIKAGVSKSDDRNSVIKDARTQGNKEGWLDSSWNFGLGKIDAKSERYVKDALKAVDALGNKYKDRINPTLVKNIYQSLVEINGIQENGELSNAFYENFENTINQITKHPDEFIKVQDDYFKVKSSVQTEVSNPVFRDMLIADMYEGANKKQVPKLDPVQYPEVFRESGRLQQYSNVKESSKANYHRALKYLETPPSSFVNEWESVNGSVKSNAPIMTMWGAHTPDENINKRAKMLADWKKYLQNLSKLPLEHQEYLSTVLGKLSEEDKNKLLKRVYGRE